MIFDFESNMWERDQKSIPQVLTDAQIEAKYDNKAERIVTETNREKLPNFYEALKKPGYMNTRPFYQRRSRWDATTQSRLIESILVNIPIPPLFVYEVAPNVHEVMDGQQRISAITAFYSNTLTLEGLERWPELNGRNYENLPKAIRDGIDRRSITWISVLQESTDSNDDAMILKQMVFERLNTGGVDLSPQEIRNALYAGPFNDVLLELSRLPAHRLAWGVPEFSSSEIKSTPPYLVEIPFYKKMEDIEVILRFFALRNHEHYQRGMRGFLDLYMLKAGHFTPVELIGLRDLYEKCIGTARVIYEDLLFHAFDAKKGKWGKTRQKALADAILIGIANNLGGIDLLQERRVEVISKTKELFRTAPEGLFTGRGNTKKDIQARINAVSIMFRDMY